MAVLGRAGKVMVIYSFDMTGLPHPKKAKLNRALYGQRSKKKLLSGKTKEYEYKGLLEGLGGRKLSAGSILVPAGAEGKSEGLFGEYGVKVIKKQVLPVSMLKWKQLEVRG